LRATAAWLAAALVPAVVAWPAPARADFKVWTPDVNAGEKALENVGDQGFDPTRAHSGEQSHTVEYEYGLNSWWQTELEAEFSRDPGPGQGTRLDQLTSENLFQFTERGQYWLDVGFFAEYGRSTLVGNASEVTLGPVLRKDYAGTSNSLNIFVSKNLGQDGSDRPQLLLAWETRIDAWQLHLGRRAVIEPGFQYYGQPGALGRFAGWNEQDERAGPQLFGKVFNLGPGTLEWNGGVLFGLTAAVPRTTLRWQLEYEIHL
jgi:hypothetical protein